MKNFTNYSPKFLEMQNGENRKGEKFNELKNIINNLPKGQWQSEYNEALLELSTNSKLSEIVNDAINNIIHGEAKKESQKI